MGLFKRKRPVVADTKTVAVSDGQSHREVALFPDSESSRCLASFPGPDLVNKCLTQSISASGVTFLLAGQCSPQAVNDEFLRLLPNFRDSAIAEAGVGFVFGDPCLPWAIITDGVISMAIYPGVAPNPAESPRAREAFDAAYIGLRQCGRLFQHSPLFNGEGPVPTLDWIEHARLAPLTELNPWCQ